MIRTSEVKTVLQRVKTSDRVCATLILVEDLEF
jgi:hypothetical protein